MQTPSTHLLVLAHSRKSEQDVKHLKVLASHPYSPHAKSPGMHCVVTQVPSWQDRSGGQLALVQGQVDLHVRFGE